MGETLMALWTRAGGVISARGATLMPLINRTENNVIITLTQEEALALVAEITSAFGADGVPATATYEKIHIHIEDPVGFYPKDMD